MAIRQDQEVDAADGEKIGVVHEVLGSPATDIFHGIVVRPHAHLRHHQFAVLAGDIETITNRRVTLKLDSQAVAGLPPYAEEESFSLGITGLFRRRPGWKEERDQRP